MTTSNNLTAFYRGWPEHQRLLVKMIAPLTPEQLALRDSTEQRPVWLLTAHIIGTRIGWFRGWMGEGDPSLDPIDLWDQGDEPTPRAAEELVEGLEKTWAMIADCLERWTPDDLAETFTKEHPDRPIIPRSRGWIIWHTLEHDIHHGGEISLTLGSHGLPALDL
ncbi:MAG: hypothetical protein AVDCRST_MAG18-1764 [uncultured Thermomicrobiales bacterium]|uniref:DinB-like domain-containing protein n=1 Tax=uncultured Thermomicrobiales bacterium TaxID=1645740 RepID=A0A6J4V5Z0_9BACT|nr:MAG: hypothetical protein AVDCRST_MAG18-1764 [uncultured Thermomicrobiales bacterium]